MILIETTTLDDAGVMLQACRTELERGGFTSQAATLKGIELLSATDAEAALSMLCGLKSTGNIQADDAVDYTKQALQNALRGARLAS